MRIKRELKNNLTYLYLVEEGYSTEKKRGETRKIKELGVEEPAKPLNGMTEEFAVVWAEGRTLGNAVPFSERVIGQFPEEASGSGVILPCDIVPCGKFRNGAQRWWCRTHQVHWGIKADLQQAAQGDRGISCSNSTQRMHYTKNPLVINPDDYLGGIGIWAALPSAINTTDEPDIDGVLIHVHARPYSQGKKSIDNNYPAVVVTSSDSLPLIANTLIKRVVIAPPSALAYLEALIENLPLGTLYCHSCQHPHLDLGDFAKNPHKKHFCGNCGVDSNWSKEPIVSSPLYELANKLTKNPDFVESDRTLDLRDYQDCQIKVWSSTPAVLWTSHLPQEMGIHVHIYQGKKKIVDDSFGKVTGFDGSSLEREKLLTTMLDKAKKTAV
ncbi:MAG: hypothetical protein V7K67_14655 [Nostoc sp.]|uniref:hypothetical protein n=1 Tax=Nostoc sp. TaxID=1180 RepID=UPI002FFC94D3